MQILLLLLCADKQCFATLIVELLTIFGYPQGEFVIFVWIGNVKMINLPRFNWTLTLKLHNLHHAVLLKNVCCFWLISVNCLICIFLFILGLYYYLYIYVLAIKCPDIHVNGRR